MQLGGANCIFYVIFASSYVTSYLFKSIIMGFPTKIQLIKRANSEQWYINLPSALAQAMEFERGEVVEWLVENKNKMILKREKRVVSSEKKKPQTAR
jgi:hypothetical protein